ncbi:MAG: hypothetical protein MHMPM18_002386 [Marteilia pararefringens]
MKTAEVDNVGDEHLDFLVDFQNESELSIWNIVYRWPTTAAAKTETINKFKIKIYLDRYPKGSENTLDLRKFKIEESQSLEGSNSADILTEMGISTIEADYQIIHSELNQTLCLAPKPNRIMINNLSIVDKKKSIAYFNPIDDHDLKQGRLVFELLSDDKIWKQFDWNLEILPYLDFALITINSSKSIGKEQNDPKKERGIKGKLQMVINYFCDSKEISFSKFRCHYVAGDQKKNSNFNFLIKHTIDGSVDSKRLQSLENAGNFQQAESDCRFRVNLSEICNSKFVIEVQKQTKSNKDSTFGVCNILNIPYPDQNIVTAVYANGKNEIESYYDIVKE